MSHGDHLFVWRFDAMVPYQHHAIDIGDGTVVHFTGEDGRGARVGGNAGQFQVRRTSMKRFVGSANQHPTRSTVNTRLHRVQHDNGLPTDSIVTRALSEVGRGCYSVAFRNCEHFATWASTGTWQSNQVDVFVERAGAIAAKAALSLGRGLAQRGLMRSFHPAGVAGDVVQFAVESIGPHAGLHEVRTRKRVGRSASLTTSVALGALAGPAGAIAAGAYWGVGEIAGVGCRAVMRGLSKPD